MKPENLQTVFPQCGHSHSKKGAQPVGLLAGWKVGQSLVSPLGPIPVSKCFPDNYLPYYRAVVVVVAAVLNIVSCFSLICQFSADSSSTTEEPRAPSAATANNNNTQVTPLTYDLERTSLASERPPALSPKDIANCLPAFS